MHKLLRLILFPLLAFFSSCEKNISFNLENTQPKLVVEATIDNGEFPLVFLSKSIDFYSRIDPATISQNFVHNAEVYVSNGVLTQKLKEFSYSVAGFGFYYYTSDISRPANIFRGDFNKQYSLRIVSEGKEYTATTSIPNPTRRIDTIFCKPAPPGNPPEFRSLMGRFTDRPGLGDYVRYYTKRNSEPFYPGLNSVYDDQIIDGTTYEVQVERGVDRSLAYSDGYGYFNVGDTVTLKLCNIDKATFDFWRTMEFVFANQGNPFSSPTKVLSNISGNALGYFGGYAAQYRTIVIR